MKRYLILIKSTETGYSAYSPDLPGCIAIGSTPEQVHQNMQDAIEFHLEGLQLEGLRSGIRLSVSATDLRLIKIAVTGLALRNHDRHPTAFWINSSLDCCCIKTKKVSRHRKDLDITTQYTID